MSTDSNVREETRDAADENRARQYYRPTVDIIEGADELVIVADLPGASADQIDVNYERGTLTLHARVAERQEAGTAYLLREYGVGDFYREFQVGEQVDTLRISAEYADGVLKLHLPKLEAAKPRKIDVQYR